MAAPQIVPVSLGSRSYDIEIGSGNLAAIGATIGAQAPPTRTCVITDAHVEPLYAEEVTASLAAAGIETGLFSVPAGEQSKSIATADRLWNELLAAGADRGTLVVALGGGVVGDLAGFVAASFARGLPFWQIPTTLLAQVDSSVGGKTGVNLPAAKNMVGAFWQPRGVTIDTQVLATLPAREYRAGLAEVVKYGVILDAEFFAWLESESDAVTRKEDAALRHVIACCCQLKADVVRQDEREEHGLRAVLNYGHTFAHALEAATAYGQLLHGEAVAIGMQCAARLAHRLGRVDDQFVTRQTALLDALGLETAVPALDPVELTDLMQHDKKTVGGQLRLILPTRLGHVELVDDVERAAVEGAWAEDG